MLRVKVEVVPHGYVEASEVVHDIWIENDGTGIHGGPDEGGVGNYNIFPPGETLGHLHMVDYPSMYACGRLMGVPRTPDHRLIVATEALSIVREWEDQITAAEAEEGFDKDRYTPPRVEREYERKVETPEPEGGFNSTGHGADGEGR